jgi:dihydroneopterin aldolase
MDLSWVHLENLKFFIFLGATEAEQMIGQNITLNLSICFPYTNTNDDIKNTIDYGKVYECVANKIKSMRRVNLLEYLIEQILNEIQINYPNIHKAKISITKGYVPLKNFSGTVTMEVERAIIS